MESQQREGLHGRARVQRAQILEGEAFLTLSVKSGVGSREEAHETDGWQSKRPRLGDINKCLVTSVGPILGEMWRPATQGGGWPVLQRGGAGREFQQLGGKGWCLYEKSCVLALLRLHLG